MKKRWALLLAAFAINVQAAQQSEAEPLFKDGKGYYSYKTPLKISLPKDKVLIQYFYSYGCDVCLSGDDYLKNYAARHQDKVVLQRSPAFEKGNAFSARMNATFAEYGRSELSDLFLFDSAGQKPEHSLTKSNQLIEKWLLKHNVNLRRFQDLFHSAGVEKRVNEDVQRYKTYSPPMIPMAILDGKYILISNTLYNDDYTYAVLDFLVDKLQQEREVK
ncbi:thiol disulfide oxidoreductase [[Actinobacillus] muris]|uniref:Thiol disulfide oxidoreductase n=1 Tax=Muribacter muris TaxID=67855 RepID=A0A0J5P4U6_9PAST|nr:thiol disulfide oxidoreductase [Muribacter muris]KMK51296.1 thiol disulfide oxidoreductase [[Actinobacillus] muris] [Muribacter muris]MBF0785855.1 thiol:disulfide interchange protein DsbA/DsbL [Muribacter muris]MBF0827231.1 thiol:disulfide interchange protein DsbA/DsbL [Muribacter muris]TFV08299.1 thiol:disulfide interchange protein DsbA/DsbL [Muribacter muris]